MDNKKTAIHITPEASDTTISNCEFEGFDVAIKNEGTRTNIIDSIFKDIKKYWYDHFIFRLITEVMIGLIVIYLAYKFGWNK